ncbi:CIR protein [Plasmodium chabaudi chabaudi]|uniref:CIR protein n=1 Tax=Plasmodium chabaudi chabaudi TaxID=31271 RepID=A0A4V0K3P1_PLACU|nr:CIR protein [Plasmodium chabaudi chabaudi]VTZ66926.1 CIR protein [Plasmodium chabaudi chabaudi]|eukprot:XP_016653132.1 CIR protein [Plasmodium chabaudi chabaudi]
MDHKLMCKYLNIADSYFKGENVNTKIINKHSTIKYYCYNGVCKTNEAGINALAAYIFKQFKVSIEANEYNKYDEYLLMWLSDKLFKIHDKSEEKDKKITLNQAYEEYLEKHKGIFDYWIFLNMQQGLKEANLRYMSEFYKLLDKICKTITDYEKKRDEITNHITNSTECSNQYISIYNDIHKCQSYLNLLNKLKGIYDDFRNYAIKETDSKINLETNLKKLTKPDGGEMNAVKGFKSYNFNNSKCKSLHNKITMSKPTDPPGLPRSSEETPSSSQSSTALEKTKTGELSSSNVQDDSKIDLKTSDNSEGNTGGASGDTGPSVGGSEDSNDGKGDKDKGELNTDDGQDDKEGSGSEQDGSDRAPVENGTQSTLGDLFNTEPLILSVSFQGVEKLNDAITSFEMIKERITESTDTIKKLYSTSLTNLENTYYKYSNFFKEIINSINTDSNEVDSPGDSDDNQSGSGGEEDEQSPPQKDSPQTSSGIQNSDKSDQGGEKTVEDQVIKSENPGTETKGNGTIGIGDIFIFKEYKKIGIPIIVIIISITLAIMYKFLVFDRRKKLKRKKMKKVPSLFGVNKTT